MTDPNLLPHILLSQFEASLAMLHECIRKCPPEHWDSPIARYPFWQVAYHTLCFVDFYLAPAEAAFRTNPEFHPAGMAELNDEYPSRRFTQPELLAYTETCLQTLRAAFAAETPTSLAAPCNFARKDFSRAELHIYNTRHIQHHAGQLSAFLRRVGVDTGWVKSGWR